MLAQLYSPGEAKVANLQIVAAGVGEEEFADLGSNFMTV